MRNLAIAIGTGVAVAAGGLAVGSAVGGGGSPPQAPGPPTAGITAVASASARVVRPVRETNASIAAAVADARHRAIPQAVARARVEALNLASAAGARLGRVAGVDETRASPYGVYYDDTGRFGPGRFCGVSVHRVYSGPYGTPHRRLLRTIHKRRCYTPLSSTAAFSVTFEIRR
jgi:hypothetical protein